MPEDIQTSPAPLKIIAVAQQKGGVGKTTISRTLALFGARESLGNKRVLIIDLDAQHSLSKLCIEMDQENGTRPPIHPDYEPGDTSWTGRSSSGDLFTDDPIVPYPVTKPYEMTNIDILPAWEKTLGDATAHARTHLEQHIYNQVAKFCNCDDVRELYDLVIIDSGPHRSPLMTSAIRAATHLIIPVEPEAQCVDGLAEMLRIWRSESESRADDNPLNLAGIVVNNIDVRTRVHNQLWEGLLSDEVISPLLTRSFIPKRAAITERDISTANPQNIFDLPKSIDAKSIMLDFCTEIFTKVFPDEAQRFDAIRREHSLDIREAS